MCTHEGQGHRGQHLPGLQVEYEVINLLLHPLGLNVGHIPLGGDN